ncbi:ecto-ADP-ribosyltransferase 3 [Pagrus major]|uniref:ecto-ADP-ribosyltransferase 3 n=1 Tax=Pagrus major TaxID=143350 RepID=UPI003CC842FB
MWDRRTLLLAAILFITLSYKGTAVEAKLLDMAPNAVDVIYTGCREQAMEKFIHSGLLGQELNHTEEFQKEWSANTKCDKLIPGGVKEHTTALGVFVNAPSESDFIRIFNDAVATTGANISTYTDDFHFKSLYFLLMDAITLLNPKTCKTLYYLSEENYAPKKGSEVRFGKFIIVDPSYSEYLKDNDMDGLFLFNINSCFYANLGDNICRKDDSALLSTTEVFTVKDVKKTTDKNDAIYTEIFLNHSRLDSMNDCDSFSRSPADVSSQWLVSVLVALSLFFFSC